MSDERIEPSIEHEYIIEVGAATDRETKERMLVVRVRTTREFTSFAYEITLNLTFSEASKHVHLEVGGLSIPSVMMPSNGGAVSERRIHLMPSGTYEFTIAKKGRTLSTTINVAKSGNVTAKPASNAFAAINA